jgi:iron-sulfur cluster assembly protein
MLRLSDEAVSTIVELAGDGGLRFVVHESDGEIEFEPALADGPEEGDEIVESGGARVFLEPHAASQLGDKVLEVHAHGDHVHFHFSPQNERA